MKFLNLFKRFRKKTFGDKPQIEEIRTADGRILRKTVANSRQSFRFLGDIYHTGILGDAELLYLYPTHPHQNLYRDKYGRLFLKSHRVIHHHYWGETNQYTFCFVNSKYDAENIVKQNCEDLPQIEPYIFLFFIQNRLPDIVLAQEYL